MKFKTGAIVVIGILTSLFSSSCYTYLSYQPIGQIKYGDNENEMRYTMAGGKVLSYNAFPEDIEADYNGNIYISEKYSSRVLKFSPSMTLLKVIELNNSVFNGNRSLCNIDLETDKEGNLYALITSERHYLNLVKYDSSGTLKKDFILSTLPGNLCSDFFISSNGKMFITTLPALVQDKKDMESVNSYVYTPEGKFLGKTDYFIDDQHGFAYKRNNLNIDQLEIGRFTNLPDTVVNTSTLKVKDTLKIDMSDQAWHFLGADNGNDIYFSQGTDKLTIRRFDFANHLIKVYRVNVEDLQRDGIVFKNRVRNVCLAPSGDIYVCGIKSALPEISEHIKVADPAAYSTMNLKDLSIVVIKFPKE